MYIYYESIVLQTCLFGPTVFPNMFPCVWHVSHLWIDWLRWERPFSSIWKLFGTMSMPCVVPEMLWSLDELKRVLISEFPILRWDWRRRGFQNIVWLVCWVGWNPVKLQQPASARSVEFGELLPRILLSGDFRPRILMSHRTRGVSSHPRGPHCTPHTYSQIICTPQKGSYTRKTCADSQKPFFLKKWTWRGLFYFFLFGGKMLWNMIIWNMGEIVVFPAFWTVAHTIAFHEILILLTRGGYGNSRLLS